MEGATRNRAQKYDSNQRNTTILPTVGTPTLSAPPSRQSLKPQGAVTPINAVVAGATGVTICDRRKNIVTPVAAATLNLA